MTNENKKPDREKRKETNLFKRDIPKPDKGFNKGEIQRRREAINRANKKPFMRRWKTSPYWFPRALYAVFNGVWIVAVSIAAFIAWLISFLLV